MADFEDLIRAVEGNDPNVQEISGMQLWHATADLIIRLCNALHRNKTVRTLDFWDLCTNTRSNPSDCRYVSSELFHSKGCIRASI